VKRSTRLSLAACVVTAVLSICSLAPANAATTDTSPPSAPGAPADAPSYDPAVPAPGPNDITWNQLAKIDTSGTFSASESNPAQPNGSVTPHGTGPITGVGGMSCTIDTGAVYKRTSGTGYQYGTVGGKPATQCTNIMISISQSTTLYKTVWWGLQQVAGPFSSSNQGEGRLQQTKVEKVCDDLRDTTFRMEVSSTGVFPNGTSGGGSAFEQATWPCGTNP
jgi:hypothetical protein